ncbi:MAG: ABC transporter substrate-binding protein [Clostridiales Family XIII bacterium]|jgi:ABC-type nitrate/sulfonate/bicarbonate transport system substrate-binding protein|nr:ABC transporter substrate-binding protein [Clostridiales Family XIII bacterium]
MKKGKKAITKIGAALLLVAMLALTLAFGACGDTDSGGDAGGASAGSSAGASAGGSSAGATAELTTIKLPCIAAFPNNTESATIGIEKGFFAEEGLEVEDVGLVAVPQYVSTLVSGTVDFILIMTSEGIAAIDNGAEIIAVAGGSDTPDNVNTHMTFLVPKGSPIKTAEDFVGKSIATPAANGGCTGGFPLEFMKQAGIEDPISKVEMITVPEESLVDTLLQGGADIVGTHLVPRVVEELYGDQVEIVFTDWDILEDRGGDMDWYATKKFVEENPETVKKFVAAIAKTNNFIDENPEEAGEIYKAAAGDIINEKLFNVRHYAPDGLIREDHTMLWVELFSEPGQVQQFKNQLTFDQLATNEFNPNA